MIKVGQIYKDGKDVYVVTNIWSSVTSDEEYFCSIDTRGVTNFYSSTRFAEENDKLIAEYPTWQEAINSKEFKGGGK